MTLWIGSVVGCGATGTDADSSGNANAGSGGSAGKQNFDGFAGTLQPGPSGGKTGSAAPNGPGPPGKWSGEHVEAGISGDPRDAFGGKATKGAITVAYPLSGAMHPVNIDDLSVHFSRGNAANNVFKLHFENDRGSYDIYTGCATERCRYSIPAASWRAIANKNAGTEVQLTVFGSSGSGPVEASEGVRILFSPEYVEGGLYYWSTGLRGSYRLVFGQRKAQPFITPDAASAPMPPTGFPRPPIGSGGSCFGCHAVSRNGDRIAWSDSVGKTHLAATASPEQRQSISNGALLTMTLNPIGSLLLVSEDTGSLSLYDAGNGSSVGTFGSSSFGDGRGAFFPEWSPDGRNIAVTLSRRGRPIEVIDGSIAVLSFNNNSLGTAKTLTTPAPGQLDFYPTWSPDGRWIAFASAPAEGRGSYDARQARLRIVSADGGQPIDLGAATQKAGVTSTWPKFAPFALKGGRYLFITFNSKMAYGYALREGESPQLWMAAIDVEKLKKGEDPSLPPIWLPFQETNQNNHLGFWTEKLGCTEGNTPTDGYGGCGEGTVCVDGRCVLPVQ